jgi:cytoskeletal protein RodZ
MRTASRTAWPIIAAIFTLAACSSNKSSAGTTTTNATTTPTVAVSSTTAVAASTTATPTKTTVAPVTTIAVTSTTTTLAPDVEVKAQYLKFTESYRACLRAPKACDPATLTASIGPARGALTKTVTDLVGADLFVGNDDPGYTAVEAVTVSESTALVTSCWWDTSVLYGPPAEAGGPPIVMNNKQVTARFESTMAFEAGRWLISEDKRVARVEGVNQCPPKV